MIPGTCPECGLRADLDVFLSSADDARALAAALTIPASLAKPVIAYLRLFAPQKKALSASRRERLLTELAGMIEAASIERRGRVYPAPIDYWRRALDAVIEKRATLKLPLHNHGYLLEIIAGIADQAGARAEQQREADQRGARRQGEPAAVGEHLREAAKKASGPRSRPPPGWKEAALGSRLKKGAGASDTSDN